MVKVAGMAAGAKHSSGIKKGPPFEKALELDGLSHPDTESTSEKMAPQAAFTF